MNRFAALTVSVLSFMACTALKGADEAPDIGHAGDKSDAGAGRGGSQQAGSGGAHSSAGEDGGHELGGAGAGDGAATAGGAGDGGSTVGGGGDSGNAIGGGGDGSGNSLPLGDCASAVEPTGTTYYFCDCAEGADPNCKAGSNAELVGTDPEHPWLTYARAQGQFENLKPGDAVAFCRGGAWNPDPDRRWVNSNACTTEAPCTIKDYAPSWDTMGTAGPPRINAGDGVAFHLFAGTGLQLQNFELRGSNLGLSVQDGVSDALLCGLTLDGFNRAAVLSDGGGTTNRIKLLDSVIRNSQGSALPMSSPCKACVIAGNLFEQNGIGSLDATLSLGGGEPAGFEIHHNVFRTHSESNKLCNGASISLSGDAANGALIAENLIEDVSSDDAKGKDCGRITFDGVEKSRVVGVTVSKNRFNNIGQSAVAFFYCDDCAIENNVFSRTVTVHDGDDNPLPYSPIANNGSTDRLIIRNNTFFAAAGVKTGDAAIVGFHQATTYPDLVLANNLVLFRAEAKDFTFMVVPPTRAFEFVDNNLCFYTNVTNGEWTPGNSLMDWKGTEGHDTHSLFKDPEINEAPGATFLQPSSLQSPVVGAGAGNRAPADDINGKERNPLAPDIGAIEHAE